MTADGACRLRLLYDGECPICSREVAALRRRDGRGVIAFEDITGSGFDAARYGLSEGEVMRVMHAVAADGRVLRGVDALAHLYELLGWRWLAKALGTWPVRPVAGLLYGVFAALRPRLRRRVRPRA